MYNSGWSGRDFSCYSPFRTKELRRQGWNSGANHLHPTNQSECFIPTPPLRPCPVPTSGHWSAVWSSSCWCLPLLSWSMSTTPAMRGRTVWLSQDGRKQVSSSNKVDHHSETSLIMFENEVIKWLCCWVGNIGMRVPWGSPFRPDQSYNRCGLALSRYPNQNS